jgi:hypothetical protein
VVDSIRVQCLGSSGLSSRTRQIVEAIMSDPRFPLRAALHALIDALENAANLVAALSAIGVFLIVTGITEMLRR